MGDFLADKSVMGWHFTAETLRDGRPIPAVGEWLIYEGEVVMCESGLHASRKALHALDYAPSLICHRVECDDIVAEDDTKLVCRRRRIAGTMDADRTDAILSRFSRQCALSVIDKWNAPDIVRRYLVTGDETIRTAARSAAWTAARSAAGTAAWTAWAAAEAAARSARSVAWAAAEAAAWTAYNEELERMLLEAIQ